MVGILVSLAVVVIFLVFCIIIYNNLISLRNQYKNAYSQIDVQLKRRYDLIPNLVESTKAYLKHERETLEAVIKARNQALDANRKAAANPGEIGAMQGLAGAEMALTGALGRLFALQEAYPDLKANQTIAGLMEELTSTENRIAFSRQAFNDAVMSYNISREKFPNVVIANPFGFKAAALFELMAQEEREAVKASF